VRPELLLDLRPPPPIVETLVDGKGNESPFEGGGIIAADRAYRDRVRDIAVRRVFAVSIREREPHHRRGDEAWQHVVSRDIRGRPENRENSEHHQSLGLLDAGQIDERRNWTLAKQLADAGNLLVQRGLFRLRRVGERNPEQREPLTAAEQRIAPPGLMFVQRDAQGVDLGALERRLRTIQQEPKMPLGGIEASAEVLAFGRLDVETEQQAVRALPVISARQGNSLRQIGSGGTKGSRRFGLLARGEIQLCQANTLATIRDERTAHVQVIDDLEQAFVRNGRAAIREHQSAHVEMRSHSL